MAEKFQRKEWDKYGGTTTKYCCENTRASTSNPDLAARRITEALSKGKEFVLPGEIVNKRGVSLRIEDLRGDFATIVRRVIGQQTNKRTQDKLREFIGFTQGEVDKITTSKDDGTTQETENPGQYAFLLSHKFYLTRLPYIDALKLFLSTLNTTYLRELLCRYPRDSKKRAELAGLDEETLENFMRQHDLSGSPLPFNYDLSPLHDNSLSTLDNLLGEDEIMFSSLYIQSLHTRTENNLQEMMKLSGLNEGNLKDLLARFPQ